MRANRHGSIGRRRATALVVSVALLGVGLGVVLDSTPAVAHVPHDVISSVAFSPNYAHDATVWTISRGHVLESTNDGITWAEKVRGIGAEALEQLVVAPSSPQRLYLASVGGVYRSTDGGTSWTITVIPGGTTHVAVSPTSADLVLATGLTSGLYRSTDGGKTWKRLVGISSSVTALSFEPGGSRVLVGTANGQIDLSLDGGATWMTRMTLPTNVAVTSLAAKPGNPAGATFAGTSTGELYRSVNAGTSFAPIGTGLPDEQVRGIAVSSNYATDATVWVSMWTSGAFRSTNGGTTFTHAANGMTTDPQADLYGVPQFDVIAAAPGSSGHDVLYDAGFNGLFRSGDGGMTWVERQTLTEYLTGLAVSPDYAQDHTVIIDSYVKGSYITQDGGSTWNFADNGLGFPLSDGNAFAPVRRMFGVTFSSGYATDGTIFSASWDHIYRSTDRGQSWTAIKPPLAPGELSEVRGFILGIAPDFPANHTLFVGTRTGAVFRTVTSGTGWELMGELGSTVRTVAVSPAYRTDGTVYVSTFAGMYKSTDRGVTWAAAGGPHTVAQLAISPQYATDGTVFAGTPAGLYVTHDHGGTWNPVAVGPYTTNRIDAVAVSPNYAVDHTLIVSERGHGIYRSTNGGVSFSVVGAALTAANHEILDFENPASAPIVFSPTFATDKTVYAFGDMDLMRSTDSGVTWSVVPVPNGSGMLQPPVVASAASIRSVPEGAAGTTTVLYVPFDLSHPYAKTVTVQYHTVDESSPGYASSTDGDFVAKSGILVYPQGATREFAEVTVNGDNRPEPNEKVLISTQNPTNATIGGIYGLGYGVITNDD